MIQSLEKFKVSVDELDDFAKNWYGKIHEACKRSQFLAPSYMWFRYYLCILALSRICDPKFLVDVYNLSRCCLEYNVSLEALMKFPDLRKIYLEYDKHAKSKYYEISKWADDFLSEKKSREYLEQKYGKNYKQYKDTAWYKKLGGIKGLFEKVNRKSEYKLYIAYSHFTHGSILYAELTTKQMKDKETILNKLITLAYCNFVCGSNAFLENAWGKIHTTDSDDCKNQFYNLTKDFLS